MVSKRAYREALSRAEACRRIERDSGRQFDPLCAAALLELVCES
jgi:HD-GYP domain-containing protein (c-di-GMP phosphodiesterase class II)